MEQLKLLVPYAFRVGATPTTNNWDFKRLAEQETKSPAHEIVYRRLREMILCGELEPGQPVTIQGLVAKLDAGMTPVREAIRRLIAEHALDFQDNRRVSVPVLTAEQMEELAFARLSLEPQLAFWAAEKITAAQIERLYEIDQELNTAIDRGDVRSYLNQNYRFHIKLYAASGADILVALIDTILLRLGPPLRVMCGRFGTSNLPDMHEEALNALRSGNPQAVSDAIRADISQGLDQIRISLAQSTA